MSEDGLTHPSPAVFSSKERAALVAKALSEAARRARFSTKKRRSTAGGGYRAKRGEKLFKLLVIWTFVGIVVVPTVLASIYFGFVASDQYTAEARFTVRGGLPPAMDGMGALTGAPPVLIIQDTQVIMNYLESRAVVDALDKSVDLRKLYRRPDIDMLSRLKANASIEKTLAYWKRHIALEVQMPSGIVVFTVKAFSADDAVKLVNAAIDASEAVVNRMNDHMISDGLALAQAERERAQANLAVAHANLEKARNQEGILSGEAASNALVNLMTQVKGQVLSLQGEYDAQRQFVSADAPQLRSLQTKIDAAKIEVTKLQDQMTDDHPDSGEKVLAGSMTKLDYAMLNNQIADSIYAGSMAVLEHARLSSELKLMYINTFIRPVASEQPRYPSRGLDIGLFLGASLAVWACVVGGLKLTRGYMS